MVKISATVLVALVVAGPALAIPAYRRDTTEQNVYQRASDAEVENLVSREPFFGLIAKAVGMAVKFGSKGAKIAKKAHSAHEKYNRHKRDMDEGSLATRQLHDEDFYSRALAEDLTERELEDLVEREPFFGLIANIAKIGLKVGMKGAKMAKKVHSAHDRINRHKRDLEEENLSARALDDEDLLERDLGEEFEERDVDAELEERYIEDLD